ncbi:addiction module protein [Massilia cavernae]|uniref:Uncharacterized protein n=1 Tax=Massilia cavernae TaxID=2320864 RepID=A0A418XS95_9BURK|nr:addiction module protein [Massilia cavernae]RJG15413.1 hypothetical protein D3872_13645 [Massilia cavernae]
MYTPKQRVAALLSHLPDDCSLQEIILHLYSLAQFDERVSMGEIEDYGLDPAAVLGLQLGDEWDEAWDQEIQRRIADLESGRDPGIPAEIVLAEARARLSK